MAKKHSQNRGFETMLLEQLPRRWKNKVHDNLYSTRIGEIKPTCWAQMTPGDTINDRIAVYSRLAPLQSPIYSKVDHKTRMFVVPFRKLMPDFETFVSSAPSDERKFIHTTIKDIFMSFYSLGYYTAFSPSTLEDFLGYAPVLDNFYNSVNIVNDPTWTYTHLAYSDFQQWSILFYHSMSQVVANVQTQLTRMGLSASDEVTDRCIGFATAVKDEKVSLMPALAYHKIYDDWVRDARLETDISEQLFDQISNVTTYPFIRVSDTFTVADINGNTTNYPIIRFLFTERFANYPKDYFTTLGDGAQIGPQLNIGPQRLEIYGSVNANVFGVDRQTIMGNPDVNAASAPAIARQKQYNVAHYIDSAGLPISGNAKVGEVWAEVNDADLITPTKLRYQMALQRFLERANVSMGKPRYNEFVFGEYGIRIPDQYLQRSVLIGASTTPVIVDEVVTQADGSANGVSSNVGDFVGRGHFRSSSRPIRGFVREHCIYMSIEYIVPQQYYWQGMRRDLTRLDNLSFPHPVFQMVGQEEVFSKELYFGVDANEPLGYQYRYSFDQIALDEIHGNFRSDLDFWRTGRNMVQDSAVNASFLRVRPTDCNRIFAYTDSRNMPFYVFTRHHMWHKMPLSDNVGTGRIG